MSARAARAVVFDFDGVLADSEPLHLAAYQEVFAALNEALQRGDEVALVTIVSSTGSTPPRVGAKMLV